MKMTIIGDWHVGISTRHDKSRHDTICQCRDGPNGIWALLFLQSLLTASETQHSQ